MNTEMRFLLFLWACLKFRKKTALTLNNYLRLLINYKAHSKIELIQRLTCLIQMEAKEIFSFLEETGLVITQVHTREPQRILKRLSIGMMYHLFGEDLEQMLKTTQHLEKRLKEPKVDLL